MAGVVSVEAQPEGAGVETLPLWPEGPPGGEAVRAALRARSESASAPAPGDRALVNIADPALTVFRPTRPDGSALMIVPGGGYLRENVDGEGTAVAQRFVSAGITAFVLLYRLPGEGWANRTAVPLVDAERAISLIRTNAQKFAIDPERIGVLGFSAGGHNAALLATRADIHPAFFALGYPVVTMLKPFAHESSREHLFGGEVSQAVREAFSCERLVTEKTPPAFLFAATDDPDVPVDNTLMLHASLRTNRVPVELHLFEKGGHGFGLGANETPASAWPELFLRWGRSRGYFRS